MEAAALTEATSALDAIAESARREVRAMQHEQEEAAARRRTEWAQAQASARHEQQYRAKHADATVRSDEVL